MYRRLKRLLFGAPIPTRHAGHQKLNVPLGIAVFAADALSSTAYATDEILIALSGAVAAASVGTLSLPIALVIALLIGIVVLSYRQIIQNYPEGGGAYIVARENLGTKASHLAAAALLIDYVLTVSVSISAGVAAITSTGFVPHSQTTIICVGLTVFITLINLRGIKESGLTFAIPAYTFLLSMALLLGNGIWKIIHSGDWPVFHLATTTPSGNGLAPFAMILICLKAFSHGCAGVTGIEAVSNGVQNFKEPRPQVANTTMTLMGMLLAGIFLGVTFLSFAFHVLPSEHETIISQLGHIIFGNGPLYLLVQIATMVLLVLAANTAFAGFPGIASLLAADGYLPRQLMNLGDRLVFNNGIIALAVLSTMLVIAYQGDTHALIPLYAVGVFITFTIAQSGMVIHHQRKKEPGWKRGRTINRLGAATTGLVTLILAFEKFTEGAWMICLAIPLLIWMFNTIHRHYQTVSRQLGLPASGYCPIAFEHPVLVLVSSLNRGTIPAIAYAKTLSSQVEAVHVSVNQAMTERLKQDWDTWGCGIPLTILNTPTRSILDATLSYIDETEKRYEHKIVTIIIPEIISHHWWHNFLHNQTAVFLKLFLRFRPGKIVTTMRYHLEE